MNGLEISSEHKDGVLVVTAVGELDALTADELSRALSGAHRLEPAARHIVLDLTGVAFIDSSGMGVLAGSVKRARAAQGTFGLVGPSGRIAAMLRISGLDKIMPVSTDVPSAVALHRGGAAGVGAALSGRGAEPLGRPGC